MIIMYVVSLTLHRVIFSQISDVSSYSNAHFGQGSGPILLKNVGCTGSESNLMNCTHDPIGAVGDCTHEDDAGVMCYYRK